jgi:hypothetical protein
MVHHSHYLSIYCEPLFGGCGIGILHAGYDDAIDRVGALSWANCFSQSEPDHSMRYELANQSLSYTQKTQPFLESFAWSSQQYKVHVNAK